MLTTPDGTIRYAEEDIGTALLKCTVQSSVFPHELGVFIQGVDRGYESLIDAALVQTENLEDGQPHSGRVEVSIIKKDAERNAVLVELPRQVVMGGRRIWVPESEVEDITADEHSLSESDQEAPR